MKGGNQVKKIGLIFLAGVVTLFLCQGAVEAKTKRQLEKEKSKEAEEREKQVKKSEELLKSEQQQKKLIDIQKTVQQQQQTIQDMIEWTKFPSVQLGLNKKEYVANEPIEAAFSLKNGSGKTFWVDGRLVAPIYEIRDQKKKAVVVSKRPEYSLPLESDMRALKPGESLSFPKGEALRVALPGTYTIRASYIFFAPEERQEGIWAGTITAAPVSFTVLPEKKP